MAAACWCPRATALSCAHTMAVVQVRSRGISVKPVDTSSSTSGVASSVRPIKQYPAARATRRTGMAGFSAAVWAKASISSSTRPWCTRRSNSTSPQTPSASGAPMSLATAKASSLSRSPVVRSPAKMARQVLVPSSFHRQYGNPVCSTSGPICSIRRSTSARSPASVQAWIR
jgi:hypothetical protein